MSHRRELVCIIGVSAAGRNHRSRGSQHRSDLPPALNNFYAAKDYPAHLCRIRYREPDTDKKPLLDASEGFQGIERPPPDGVRPDAGLRPQE